MPIDTRTSPVIPWDSTAGSEVGDIGFQNATSSGNLASNLPIRRADSRYLTSKIRGLLEVSDGERPAETFLPDPALPISFLDVELQDGVVIPKGTIVSGVKLANASTKYANLANPTATSNDDYYGYPDNVQTLLVPANGSGANGYLTYGSDDVGRTIVAGAALTAANSNHSNYDPTADQSAGGSQYTLTANNPIGYAYMDVYQDQRGNLLNWEPLNLLRGVLTDYYIELVFISDSHITVNADKSLPTANFDKYHAVRRMGGMLYGQPDGGGSIGAIVRADVLGMTVAPVTVPGVDQRVGRVISYDFRWPKDMQAYVETYPGSEMPGTETGGIPSHIYWPATLGLGLTLAQLQAAITARQIGTVRILVDL